MPTRPTYYLICTHMESISTKTASQNSNGISKMRPENVEVDQPRSPAQSPQITKPIQTAQIAKVAQPRNTRPIPATSAAFTKSTANSIWSHRTRQATAMATSVSNRAPNSNQVQYYSSFLHNLLHNKSRQISLLIEFKIWNSELVSFSDSSSICYWRRFCKFS